MSIIWYGMTPYSKRVTGVQKGAGNSVQTIRSLLSKHASAAAVMPCLAALLPTSNHWVSVKYFRRLLEIDLYTFETSSLTMFIAENERTLVKMQPLGI